jgi:2-haloalkanoic acid dehalogenase type II
MPIRAICFDLDNTLWDVWPTIMRAEQATYAFLTERYPRIAHRYSIEGLRAERERIAAQHAHRSHDFTFIRIATLQACAESVGYSEPVGDEAFEVFFRERNNVSFYRDALPVLEQLHGRYRLFSLTNGNADLRAIGIDRFFEGSFAARDVGVLKPDAAIFNRVLEAAGLAAHEVAHVGDDPVADVYGAHAVGMRAVWLNRDGALWQHTHGAPPLTISALDDLSRCLD